MTGLSDDEAIAAEYVLGTLDAAERAAAAERRNIDRDFDTLVRDWEERLGPLATANPDVAPPAAVFERVLLAIQRNGGPPRTGDVVALRRQVRLWRGAALVATALAAMLAIWVAQRESTTTGPDRSYVAVLQQGGGAPAFVVSLDLAHQRMSVRPLGTSAPADKSYQLWMIGGDARPRSMGLVDTDAPIRPVLPDLDGTAITGATYAVTLEPRGGSPTGQPTSAPIFVGKMVDMAL